MLFAFIVPQSEKRTLQFLLQEETGGDTSFVRHLVLEIS